MTTKEAIKVLKHCAATGFPDEDSSSFSFNAPTQQVRQALDMAIDVLRRVDITGYKPHPGHWEYRGRQKGYFCTYCGGGCLLNMESDWHESTYCPHCGAKMVPEESEKDEEDEDAEDQD